MLRISKTDEEIDKIIHAQRCAEDALKKSSRISNREKRSGKFPMRSKWRIKL